MESFQGGLRLKLPWSPLKGGTWEREGEEWGRQLKHPESIQIPITTISFYILVNLH